MIWAQKAGFQVCILSLHLIVNVFICVCKYIFPIFDSTGILKSYILRDQLYLCCKCSTNILNFVFVNFYV